MDGNGPSGPRFVRFAQGAVTPLVKRFIAGREVARWARAGSPVEGERAPDALLASEVPSCSTSLADRALAELDQDGYAFALDERDRAVFDRRSDRLERTKGHYSLEVVLRDGSVCLRKTFRRPPITAGLRKWISGWLGVNFYTEAAAFVRLRGCPGVPALHALDLDNRSLYIDFIHGDTLKQLLAREGLPVHDIDLDRMPGTLGLSPEERAVRGFEQLVRWMDEAAADRRWDVWGPVAEAVGAMNERGVTVADVKLDHAIVGRKTGRVYWVDFEWSWLDSYPDWPARLASQWETLERLFGRSHGREWRGSG